MKILSTLVVVISGAFLIWATADLPEWGSPNTPASTHVSPRYIEKAVEETAVPNIVTAVLADYRSYDTMFETTVIFCAGLACFLLMRHFQKEPQDTYYRHLPTGITLHIKGKRSGSLKSREFEKIDPLWVPYDMIIKTVSRFLVPLIQLFALYVIAHGHHSPGGGFQGGVILGASIIVVALSFNLRAALDRIRERVTGIFISLGVFIYSGIGALCILLGAAYLDYKALAKVLPVDQIMARSHGILGVEIGVGLTVMAVMICIYNNLASEGKYDEGL